MDSPTWRLCASGRMTFLLREASGIAINLTAHSILPSNVSDVPSQIYHTFSILDLTMLL